jgi:hypothetical protein
LKFVINHPNGCWQGRTDVFPEMALSDDDRPDRGPSKSFARPPPLFPVNDPERIVLETNKHRLLLPVPQTLTDFLDRFLRIDDPAIGADFRDFYVASVGFHRSPLV